MNIKFQRKFPHFQLLASTQTFPEFCQRTSARRRAILNFSFFSAHFSYERSNHRSKTWEKGELSQNFGIFSAVNVRTRFQEMEQWFKSNNHSCSVPLLSPNLLPFPSALQIFWPWKWGLNQSTCHAYIELESREIFLEMLLFFLAFYSFCCKDDLELGLLACSSESHSVSGGVHLWKTLQIWLQIIGH